MLIKIISTGQTDIDRAALDTAIEHDILHGGFVDRDTLKNKKHMLGQYNLREMPIETDITDTEYNLINSNGTLIITFGPLEVDGNRIKEKALKHNQPWLHLDLNKNKQFDSVSKALEWLKGNSIQFLNVYGQKANKVSNVYERSKDTIKSLISNDIYYSTVSQAICKDAGYGLNNKKAQNISQFDFRKTFRFRSTVVLILFLSVFFLILSRAIFIQVFMGERLSSRARQEYPRVFEKENRRGDILDRNSVLLATIIKGYSIGVRPYRVYNEGLTVRALSDALHIDEERLRNNFLDMESKEKRFGWILRHVTRTQADKVKAMMLNGIVIERENYRFYPMGSVASTILGFAGTDHTGLEGLEFIFDKQLAGTAEVSWQTVDALGSTIERGASVVDLSHSERSIRLTIDIFLNKSMEQLMMDSMVSQNDYRSFFGTIIDISNGEILAIASIPNFNPNNLSEYNNANGIDRNTHQMFQPGISLDFLIALNEEAEINRCVYEDITSQVKLIVPLDNLNGCWKTLRSKHIRDGRSVAHERILGGEISSLRLYQDTGFVPDSNFLDENANDFPVLGEIVICNPIQISTLYLNMVFAEKVEPVLIYPEKSGQTTTNGSALIERDTILNFHSETSGSTNRFLSRKTTGAAVQTYLDISIGWFEVLGRRFLLTLGGVKGDSSDRNNCVPKEWVRTRDAVSDYYRRVEDQMVSAIELQQRNVKRIQNKALSIISE